MKKPSTPLQKVSGEIGLKGWVMDCLEDADIFGPLKDRLDDLVLQAAGEALSLVMQQDDVMTFLSFGEKKLELWIVVPLGAEEGGETTWKIDLEEAVLSEIELVSDGDRHQKRKVAAIRSRLQHLVDECSKALTQK